MKIDVSKKEIFSIGEIKMNGKVIGTVLGVVGTLLWFMPLVHVSFMGIDAYQTGVHIGGIAYILILASLAYAVLSWMGQHVPRIIAASVALAISLLFLAQAGASLAWGLLALILVNVVSLYIAVRDNKSSLTVKA
jgi:hypothetical protein